MKYPLRRANEMPVMMIDDRPKAVTPRHRTQTTWYASSKPGAMVVVSSRARRRRTLEPAPDDDVVSLHG